MKLHANAALSLNRRRLLCRRVTEERRSLAEAAEAAEVSEPTARKWVARYLAEGEAGLLDRSSAAHRVHNRTPEERIEVICALRRLRFTGAEIAEILGMAETTVSGILTRIGLGRLGRIGLEPPRRYERSRPGELLHVDVKKLGRIDRGMGKRITGRRRHWSPTRTDRAGVRRKTVGWESSTSASTTPPGSPTSRSWATSGQPRRPASCAVRCASSPATGSRSNGC
jgi:transposase